MLVSFCSKEAARGTTEAGEALAHHARLILRQHSLLQGELRDFGAGARGTLLLYANTAALTGLLPQRRAPWLAQRPRLNMQDWPKRVWYQMQSRQRQQTPR
jgi:DNA-binding transcriptional LysR family regulator